MLFDKRAEVAADPKLSLLLFRCLSQGNVQALEQFLAQTQPTPPAPLEPLTHASPRAKAAGLPTLRTPDPTLA